MSFVKKFSMISFILFPFFTFAHGNEQSTISRVGKPGKEANVSRTIEIKTYDTMKFNPKKIDIKKGETIKFNVINPDKLSHEFMIGEMNELKKHAKMMQKMPDMKHVEKNAVTVEAGQTKSLVWEFDKVGEIDFGCFVPGHSEAGMIGVIHVTKK